MFSRNRCPCRNYFMYSLVMMIGPALFLLGLGFMTSEGFWQSILKTSRLQHANERCNYRMKSLSKLFQPFLPPMAYITIALLHGDFLVCSSLGSFSATCYSNIPDTIISQVRKNKHWQGRIQDFLKGVAGTLGLQNPRDMPQRRCNLRIGI